MKHLLFIGFLFSGVAAINAQVKIGGNPVAPHSSAVLELDGGSTRGLLLPRMRKQDMLDIASPAEGLTLYVTDEQATYLRRQGSWIKLSGSSDNFELPYTGLFNLAGAPVLSLSNLGSGGTGIYGASNVGAGAGVHGFSTAAGSFAIKGTSNFGRGGYFSSKVGQALVTDTGKIGLGILNPSAFLEVDATRNATDTTVIINDDQDPVIQFKKSGLNKSYIKQEGNNLVLRPNGQNFAGKVILQSYNTGPSMFVDANGNSSFGVDAATFSGTYDNSRVHIKGSENNVLTLESPTGYTGPELTFMQKAGNTPNEYAKILAETDELRFIQKEDVFKWGLSPSGLMELKRSDPVFGVASLGIGEYGNGGYLGVGTKDPEAPLHVAEIIWDNVITAIMEGGDPIVHFRQMSGADRDKGFIQLLGDDMKIGTFANNDKGRFVVRTNGSDKLWVDSVGYVTIGGKIGPTLNGPYKLAVKGKVAATDFNVVAVGSWPDYVFADDYKLRSLEETEAFIKVNKHLPNIPAAAVVEKEGIALGDMQKRMMEKIEELTLYLIDAKKELNNFKAEANKEIEQLKQQVQILQPKK
ncbi:MAG: hypothetical protein V4722_16605 [Bacteroidota bacterium]